MKYNIEILIKSILAGIMIGIGGTIYLSLDNKIVGSIITIRSISRVDRYRAVPFCAHIRGFIYILCYIGIHIAGYNNIMLSR